MQLAASRCATCVYFGAGTYMDVAAAVRVVNVHVALGGMELLFSHLLLSLSVFLLSLFFASSSLLQLVLLPLLYLLLLLL